MRRSKYKPAYALMTHYFHVFTEISVWSWKFGLKSLVNMYKNPGTSGGSPGDGDPSGFKQRGRVQVFPVVWQQSAISSSRTLTSKYGKMQPQQSVSPGVCAVSGRLDASRPRVSVCAPARLDTRAVPRSTASHDERPRTRLSKCRR